MGLLADLTGFVLYKDGVAVATRQKVNFIGDGFTLADDPANARADIRATLAAVTDPTSGFSVRLLPQLDTTTQSANATPITLATITLSDNTVYEFGVYAQAYAAAYAQETVQEFGSLCRRSNAGGATKLTDLPLLFINPLTIVGVTIEVSGNNVLVKWTGHASTTLKARVQVGYTSRPIVLPT